MVQLTYRLGRQRPSTEAPQSAQLIAGFDARDYCRSDRRPRRGAAQVALFDDIEVFDNPH